MTRRKLARVLAAAPAAAGAQSQPASPPSTPAEELALARERVRGVSEVLARQQVPMDVEPACHFKA